MKPTIPSPLQDIRGYAGANRIDISRHAYDELAEAGGVEADLRHALVNARTCVPGNKPGTWKVTGPDTDGDDLNAVVTVAGQVFVITVY